MKFSIWHVLCHSPWISTWPHHGAKKKASSVLLGFGIFLGASVLTVCSFILPTIFPSLTDPLLKNNLDRYIFKQAFTRLHYFPNTKISTSQAEKYSTTQYNNQPETYYPSSLGCDIFEGEWVMVKDQKQYYTPGSCPYLETGSFNCHGNGRPEDGYLKWQWQWQSHPKNAGCKDSLPSILNATDFLERLRGKKLVFAGDSLNRNMYMSMVCILWSAILDKSTVVRPSGDFTTIYKDYNCTVQYVTSPFLVGYGEVSKSTQRTLRLDLIDEQAASSYRDADVLVFNSWHWWAPGKTNKGINFFQEGDNLYPKLDMNNAYRIALATWSKWVDKHIDPNKTQVVFRGFSPNHFQGGTWNTGGGCKLATKPILSSETYITKAPIQLKILEDTLRKMKTQVLYLNVGKLTYYRADAHPSVYRDIYKNYTDPERIKARQDCSHWCLPGVPDTWNELLYAALLKDGKGYFGKL